MTAQASMIRVDLMMGAGDFELRLDAAKMWTRPGLSCRESGRLWPIVFNPNFCNRQHGSRFSKRDDVFPPLVIEASVL